MENGEDVALDLLANLGDEVRVLSGATQGPPPSSTEPFQEHSRRFVPGCPNDYRDRWLFQSYQGFVPVVAVVEYEFPTRELHDQRRNVPPASYSIQDCGDPLFETFWHNLVLHPFFRSATSFDNIHWN